MKRMVVIVLGFSALAFSATAYAQTDAELVEQSLAAAPRRGRDDATVVKWAADHTYTTIQEGTNSIVCYSRADQRGRPPFAVQCTSLANLDRVAQNRQFRAESMDADGERALVAAAAEDGSREDVEFGSWFRSMNGQDQASAGVHTTIAMPGATGESSGFPEGREQGGAFIMAAGTTEAHLMVP
jgi:Ni/Co efflux regulator RcnB